MAKTLVTSCRFPVQGAIDCAIQVQTAEIAVVKGEKAATAFADSLQILDAERFSIKAGSALSRVQKLASTGHADVSDDDREGRRKRRKPGKPGKGRKCIRCKKGPFTHADFQEHNKVCK